LIDLAASLSRDSKLERVGDPRGENGLGVQRWEEEEQISLSRSGSRSERGLHKKGACAMDDCLSVQISAGVKSAAVAISDERGQDYQAAASLTVNIAKKFQERLAKCGGGRRRRVHYFASDKPELQRLMMFFYENQLKSAIF
jgi:hypothetical protein